MAWLLCFDIHSIPLSLSLSLSLPRRLCGTTWPGPQSSAPCSSGPAPPPPSRRRRRKKYRCRPEPHYRSTPSPSPSLVSPLLWFDAVVAFHMRMPPSPPLTHALHPTNAHTNAHTGVPGRHRHVPPRQTARRSVHGDPDEDPVRLRRGGERQGREPRPCRHLWRRILRAKWLAELM